ncbi:hypothetical protein ACM64Y_04945 [Novispirillum sp. DQ9]|uniref:hypothetical protein n=1 Tax=Novispirillum sp. DQ9 TaxID=3398612 RepID=UPI003C7D4948
MKRISSFLLALSLAWGSTAPGWANGLGEQRSAQFRSPNERQVLANLEALRLQQAGDLRTGTGVGGTVGLGTTVGGQPTGNVLSITVSGTGNVLNLDLTQDNTGDQSTDNTVNGTPPPAGGQ